MYRVLASSKEDPGGVCRAALVGVLAALVRELLAEDTAMRDPTGGLDEAPED